MFHLSQFQTSVLIAIIIALVALVVISYIGKLKTTNERQRARIKDILQTQKEMRDSVIAHQAYAGNDFTTFAGYPADTLYDRVDDKQTFILIRRDQLHNAVADAYAKGHGLQLEVATTLRSVMKELSEDVEQPMDQQSIGNAEPSKSRFRLFPRNAQLAG